MTFKYIINMFRGHDIIIGITHLIIIRFEIPRGKHVNK